MLLIACVNHCMHHAGLNSRMNGGVVMRSRDDVVTLWALGALVAITGSIVHEVLGHSLVCMASGGHVTLLTFLVFRCDPGNAFTAAAGPMAALVMGTMSLLLLRWVPQRNANWRVFLFTLGILLLFWTWAQLVRNSLQGNDDWGWVARDLGWQTVWHWIGAATGIAGYVFTMRVSANLARQVAAGAPSRLIHPWLAAILAAIMLGGMWHGGRMASALDGFMTFGVAALGYVPALRASADGTASQDITRNWRWITVSVITFTAFTLTIAQGVGVLA